MKQYIYPFICAALLTVGCQKNQDTAMLSQKQLLKPSVAIVPLIDNSDHALGWNLSDEITYTLCSKLHEKNTLNLTLPGKIRAQSKRVKGQMNPFTQDLNWIKKTFTDEEFVVFLEMIEHSEIPSQTVSDKKTPKEALSANLLVSVRVRIVDLRGETPKITLQEIIQDSHFIPRQFTQYNFHQSPWNTEEFLLSPVGIAHAQLIKELKNRIEDYILLAKSGN